MNPILRAAREYLDRGWSVLPVGPDKRPLVKWGWLQTEQPSVRLVERWFADGHAGVAVVCGRVSGLLVLDIEVHAVRQFADLPSTLLALSQSGGAHYYYAYDPRPHRVYRTVAGVHVGDLKGNGGYVVAPPSRGPRGVYQWMNAEPIAKPPDWLFAERPDPQPLAAMSSSAESACRAEFVSSSIYPSRNERLLAIARRVISAGGDREEVERACLSDWAGSKIRHRSEEGRKRYVDGMLEEISRTPPPTGEVVEATIMAVEHSRTKKGNRVTLRMGLPDGRRIRQGVTLIDGTRRTEAFLRAVPDPRPGRSLWIEVYEKEYLGKSVLRVRRFLEKEELHESQA